MLTALLPEEVRGGSLGYVATFAALGVALGPAAGGFLTAFGRWRRIFLSTSRCASWPPCSGYGPSPASFPGPRPALTFAALASLVLVLNEGERAGWHSPPHPGRVRMCNRGRRAASGPGVAASRPDHRSHRSLEPTRHPGQHRRLPGDGGVHRGGLSPPLLPGTGGGCRDRDGGADPDGPLAGDDGGGTGGGCHLGSPGGVRPVCVAATLLCTGAFFLFSGLQVGSGLPFLLGSLALMGAGVGAFIPPNSTLILGWSPPEKRGLTSSMMMTVRDLGGGLRDRRLPDRLCPGTRRVTGRNRLRFPDSRVPGGVWGGDDARSRGGCRIGRRPVTAIVIGATPPRT